MNKQIMIFIPVAIVLAGGSFFGGMEFQKTQKSPINSNQNFGNFQRQGGPMNIGGTTGVAKRGNMGGFSNGTVLSKDDKSITIKLKNGGSQIVFLGESTSVLKSVSGSKDDLVIDQSITVTGKTNSDGSLAADSIQIRPEGETVPLMPNNINNTLPAAK